jgi:aldose sugar dehydrogenase
MKKILILISLNFVLFACKIEKTPEIIKTEISQKDISKLEPKISLETIFSDRGIIWGYDFLPNNDIIFTEKSGKLSIFSKGQITEVTGLPTNINADGQGGLLDVVIHPDFAKNNWIYITYSSLKNNLGILNMVRAKLQNNVLSQLEPLFATSASNVWKGHYGSRMVFDKAGFLYISIGEGGLSSYGGKTSPNQNAQNLKEAWGKIHRLKDDGSIPSDNPIFGDAKAPSSIYSYGHRNPQGLMYNATTGQIFNTEHGPKGGDELNLVLKGKNYGWPLVSYGVNYDGKTISESPKADGIEDVQYQWTPSIGSCGLAIISSDKYGIWKGDILSGSLALQYLSKLSKNASGEYANKKLLEGIGRVRNVKLAPDGYVYVSVESPGRIIKLNPSFE